MYGNATIYCAQCLASRQDRISIISSSRRVVGEQTKRQPWLPFCFRACRDEGPKRRPYIVAGKLLLFDLGLAAQILHQARDLFLLLPRELPQVVEAFTTNWAKPEEVERAKVRDAVAITLTADHEIRAGEKPADIARTLTYAIWQKLDRYVKVTVAATYLSETPDAHFEYGESAYAEAFGTRFEN